MAGFMVSIGEPISRKLIHLLSTTRAVWDKLVNYDESKIHQFKVPNDQDLLVAESGTECSS
jgi:hypothetical protein